MYLKQTPTAFKSSGHLCNTLPAATAAAAPAPTAGELHCCYSPAAKATLTAATGICCLTQLLLYPSCCYCCYCCERLYTNTVEHTCALLTAARSWMFSWPVPVQHRLLLHLGLLLHPTAVTQRTAAPPSRLLHPTAASTAAAPAHRCLVLHVQLVSARQHQALKH
jgi:hypothetical protein